jgi:tRNA-dependent cyclodipeptide synthase
MSDYKVKVLSNASWRNYKKARLDISLQNTKQVGEKFEATLLWALENFDEIEVSLADTLQRHTFSADYDIPLDKANNLTLREGDIWIQCHSDLLTRHNVVVKRWDERIQDTAFEFFHNQVRELYSQDKTFKDLVNSDCQSFMSRRNYCETKKLFVLNYILEEQAVFSMLSERDQAIGIYPGSILGCYRGHDRPDLFAKTEFCKIDFLRKKTAEL